jgi:exonuclease III
MDYKLKIKKYKQKLEFGGIGIKYTKEDYDSLHKDKQDEFPFYCQDDKPYMCSLESKSYGLCKNKITDCTKYTGENTYLTYDLTPERIAKLEYGKNYGGYDLYGNNDKDCSRLIENSRVEYGINNIVPNKFKIMTYNLWWSMKITGDPTKDTFHRNFLEIRMKEIAKIINESTADIICLQEVGKLSFDTILPIINTNYPYYYEIPFLPNENDKGSRGRSIETVCFSKYPVNNFKLYSVQGNLQYNNSMLILEFENLIVFNVYLQAGTRNSPGQQDLWFNYSRCRYNEYLAIDRYLKESKINKPIIVLGDFNTNLNGDISEWPELKAFNQLNLQDSWIEKYGNTGGFTENTEVNFMRWNLKFEEKIYRIDGIFYTKDKLKTNEIVILGNNHINIDKDMQDQFYDIRIPNKLNKDVLIRRINGELQLWPSDHFAVMAELEFI